MNQSRNPLKILKNYWLKQRHKHVAWGRAPRLPGPELVCTLHNAHCAMYTEPALEEAVSDTTT